MLHSYRWVGERNILDVRLRDATGKQDLGIARKPVLSSCVWKSGALEPILSFLEDGNLTDAVSWVNVTEHVLVQPIESLLRCNRERKDGVQGLTRAGLHRELKR